MLLICGSELCESHAETCGTCRSIFCPSCGSLQRHHSPRHQAGEPTASLPEGPLTSPGSALGTIAYMSPEGAGRRSRGAHGSVLIRCRVVRIEYRAACILWPYLWRDLRCHPKPAANPASADQAPASFGVGADYFQIP